MEQTLPQIKVIVVGASGVGKSSILFRFLGYSWGSLRFKDPQLWRQQNNKISSKKIIIYVWDTAGQQKYKSIAPIYYRQSQIALCVYDITNKQSFQVLKNWVEQLKTKGPQNILITVVGNKIDRTEQQAVSYNDAKVYAESVGAQLKLTSAKEGKGINQMFSAIAQRLDQKNQQIQMMKNSKKSGKKVPLKSGGKVQNEGCCAKKK